MGGGHGGGWGDTLGDEMMKSWPKKASHGTGIFHIIYIYLRLFTYIPYWLIFLTVNDRPWTIDYVMGCLIAMKVVVWFAQGIARKTPNKQPEGFILHTWLLCSKMRSMKGVLFQVDCCFEICRLVFDVIFSWVVWRPHSHLLGHIGFERWKKSWRHHLWLWI